MKTISIIFLIVIFICHNVHAADLFVTSSNEKDLAHNLVPCMLNEDCQDYPNGVCKNNFCECNGTKFCEDKVSTIVTKIGEFCTIDAHCNLDQASCKGDKCTCDDGTIQSLDGRKCLNSSDQPCIGETSCNGFDTENNQTECIPGKCECEEERIYCRNDVRQKTGTLYQKPTSTTQEGNNQKKRVISKEEQFIEEHCYMILLSLLMSLFLLYEVKHVMTEAIVFMLAASYIYFLGVFGSFMFLGDLYEAHLLIMNTFYIFSLSFILVCSALFLAWLCVAKSRQRARNRPMVRIVDNPALFIKRDLYYRLR